MKTATLKELSNNLPIPLTDGTRPSFNFKAWRFSEEKEIGKLKTKYPHLGRMIREIFNYMLSDWNGKPWLTLNENERKLLLNQLSWANVFYMYVYLRVDALGEDLKMNDFQCPKCQAPIEKYVADLESVEVKMAGYKPKLDDDGEPIEDQFEEDSEFKRTTVYELKKPFIVGEVEVTGIEFGFTPWDAMEKLKAHDRNEGSVKESMLRNSIVGAVTKEGGKVSLDKNKVLNGMGKRDIEGFYDALDDFNGGPRLALEVSCPSCAETSVIPFNWTYDYFFGSSSL